MSKLRSDLDTIRTMAARYYQLADADMKLLYVTCGLPRSGKSSWARATGLPMVDPDAVRLAFQGRTFIQETEEWIWNLVRNMVRSLFHAGHNDVIVQGTNAAEHHRTQWRRDRQPVDRKLWFPVFCLFPTSAEVCQERAIKTNRPDLIAVMNATMRIWKTPSLHEGMVVKIQEDGVPDFGGLPI